MKNEQKFKVQGLKTRSLCLALAMSIATTNCSSASSANVAAAGDGGGLVGDRGGQSGSPSASGGGAAGEGGSAGTPIGSGGTSGRSSSGGAVGAQGGDGTAGSTAAGAAAGGASNGGEAGRGGASSNATHWVGTWSASPYLDASNPPPAPLANSVLRQVTHVSLGGSQIRVQFSNLFGNGPLAIHAAHVALCKATPAVDSTIDTATDKTLTFSGMTSVTIVQGKEIWSDPIAFTVTALGNVSITTAFDAVPSDLTTHSGSRTTSYVLAGSDVSAASMTSAKTGEHWWFISGIDVMADASARAAVAIGDSITDGRGTDNNKNNRWTDILAARLQASPTTANVAILNQGIGATNLVGGSKAAVSRFARDVLGQSGVRYAIVYDGVNDIGGGASFASLKSGYETLIAAAHAKQVLIYGGTILPFGGNSYYSAAHESVRQQVNTYIKSGAFDGFIDFDAALTDGGNPPKLKAADAAWSQMDWLHPGPAGYQALGAAVDLTLFTK